MLTVYAHLFSAKHAETIRYTHIQIQTDKLTVRQTDKDRQRDRHEKTDRQTEKGTRAFITKSDEKRERGKH